VSHPVHPAPLGPGAQLVSSFFFVVPSVTIRFSPVFDQLSSSFLSRERVHKNTYPSAARVEFDFVFDFAPQPARYVRLREMPDCVPNAIIE
jgi:hypothetical protein